jgi:hypothetical protein
LACTRYTNEKIGEIIREIIEEIFEGSGSKSMRKVNV